MANAAVAGDVWVCACVCIHGCGLGAVLKGVGSGQATDVLVGEVGIFVAKYGCAVNRVFGSGVGVSVSYRVGLVKLG